MHTVIAVSCDRTRAEAQDGGVIAPDEHGRIRPREATVVVASAVVQALRAAGIEPILLPPEPADTPGLVEWVMDHVGGIVLTGGHFDIHPQHYGQAINARIDRVDEGRTELELALARACIAKDVPLLGICGGMQVMAVAAGGSLVQDIRTADPSAMQHEQPGDPRTAHHPVSLNPGLIYKAHGVGMIRVNSTHHQAVDDPGPFLVSGRAPDGTIEAIEHPHLSCCVGVQWHPELLDTAPFRMLAHFAKLHRPAR